MVQSGSASEGQISIENVTRGPAKEGSFVAIQLPRWPPITGGLTRRYPAESSALESPSSDQDQAAGSVCALFSVRTSIIAVTTCRNDPHTHVQPLRRHRSEQASYQDPTSTEHRAAKASRTRDKQTCSTPGACPDSRNINSCDHQ